jgi:hypothetical protein
MERPGFKSEESSLMMTTYATLDINEGSTIWEVQLDQCLSDAGVFENKVSLSGAPWEVRLASRLLHERHASHLLTVLLTHLLFWCIVVYGPTCRSQLPWFTAMKVEGFVLFLAYILLPKTECWGFN